MYKVQNVFAQIVKNSLADTENHCVSYADDLPGSEYAELVRLAGIHKLSALVFDEFKMLSLCPPALMRQIDQMALSTVNTSFDLIYVSGDISERLKQNGIPFVIIKGITAASYYKQPLCRKSGDIDLLIPQSILYEAVDVCKGIGYEVKEIQRAHHHVVMAKEGSPDIELHTMLAEPFDDTGVNELLAKRLSCLFEDYEKEKNCFQTKDILGFSFEMLSDAYMAYELLLHMLQHYLRSGFGIRLLCDWVVLWNNPECESAADEYLSLVDECGIKGFSDIITSVCVRYIGLDERALNLLKVNTSFTDEELEIFFSEFLSAGEFGKTSKDRMVSLRGDRPSDYFREFHHQMKLNFPKVSRFFLIWPILWIVTFVRFMVNNKKVRNVKLSAVVTKAGERGKLNRKLGLFSRKK